MSTDYVSLAVLASSIYFDRETLQKCWFQSIMDQFKPLFSCGVDGSHLVRLDQAVGAVFVAERYWWNSLPDGTWIDLSPRPSSWPQLLLVEELDAKTSKERTLVLKTQVF